MPSFSKANGHWRCRIYDPEIPTATHRASGSGRTKREALAAAEAKRRVLVQRLAADAARLTVGEYLTHWLDQHAAHVSALTLHGYRARLARHVLPHLGHLALARLRPADVQGLYGRLTTSGRLDGRAGGLSPRTTQGVHIALHKALADAVRLQVVARNIMDAVTPPRATVPPVEAPLVSDAHAVLDAVAGTLVAGEVAFAIYAGVRQGEMLALRWADVDLDEARATVYRSVSRVPGRGLVVKVPKTRRSARTVPLVPDLVDELRRHRSAQLEQRLRVGLAWEDQGLMFPNSVGGIQDARNVLRRFHRALDAAGLPRMRWHDLRHWAASLMIAAGMDLVMVSRALGHTSITITADTYGHLETATLAREFEKFGRAMRLGASR